MNDGPAGAVELDQALAALAHIGRLAAEDRQVFDASEDRRLALVACWINVGSALKQYCHLRGLPQGQQPYRGAIRLRDRLCYKPLSMIDYEIVWTTTTGETAKLTALLTEIYQAWAGSTQHNRHST